MILRCAFCIDKDARREAEIKSSTTPSNNNSINHSPDIKSNSLEDAKLPETNSPTRFNHFINFYGYCFCNSYCFDVCGVVDGASCMIRCFVCCTLEPPSMLLSVITQMLMWYHWIPY